MQAVAAHEYLESLRHLNGRAGAYPSDVVDAIRIARNPAADPTLTNQAMMKIHDYGHYAAIDQAPTTQLLNLSDEARQLLREYRDWAVREGHIPGP